MYYTGLDPRGLDLTGGSPQDLKSVYVCRNPHEKAMQRALIQYRNPKNYDLVYEALTQAGRTDLIGYDKKCLIRPRRFPARPRGMSQIEEKRELPAKPPRLAPAERKQEI